MAPTKTGAQYTLAGTFAVALPPEEAFRLFTPRGEQDWAEGWLPRFPTGATDDTAPGTVFETDADGTTTTWMVLDREWGRRISYARVTPTVRAGTVTVVVDGANGHSDVRVTYELTALTDAAEPELREFAAGHPAFLRSWQDAIAAVLRRR
jgi:hypothetical protein